LTGCPTEAETETVTVTVPGDQVPVVPDNAVRADSEAALRGLLAANSGVSVIDYTSTAPTAALTIPSGKTVYLNGNALTLGANLAVASGAKVVVVKSLTTAGDGKKLLVNGTVEVARNAMLAYGTAATEVTSYTESSGVITPGSATVIGDTGKVRVLKDGLLGLKTADVSETEADKFTLAQAWSAAGSGHLSIDGDTDFPVSVLTALATATRGILATTTATAALPGTIPALADITVKGAITDAGSDHKLTVNGILQTDGDDFTGAAITEIAVGDGGKFITDSTGFSTAALTKITVGKGATFTSGDADAATYALVTEITVGAGSTVTVDADATFDALATLSVGAAATFNAVAATAPTYAALETLSVGDYGTATLAAATATDVTFEATDGLGTLTLGNHAAVSAGAATAANLGKSGDTFSIGKDATLGGVTVPAGATLTVATGATLTVGGVLTVSGTLEIAGNGKVLLTAAATSVVLKADGAIDVKDATGAFGEATQTATKMKVGAAATPGTATKALVANATTTWTVTTDSTGTDVSSSGFIVLGTLKLAFNGTSNVSAAAGADAAGNAAAGKLVAGTGTAITFIGTD
jgi:hypothetical protein